MMMRRLILLGLFLAALPTLVPDTVEARSVYKRGQTVRFEGRVTGLDGRPLAGLTVALEVSRKGYRLRGLRLKGLKKEKHDSLQLLTSTDSDGRYVMDWSWDSHYNVFELLAALPVETSASPVLEVLERVEVTPRVEQTNPVVTPISVEAGVFVTWLQRYSGGDVSDDEARIYRELGRPDRLDVVEEDGESSWWYFELGKVYRFQKGGLEQVTHFEPVKDVVP